LPRDVPGRDLPGRDLPGRDLTGRDLTGIGSRCERRLPGSRAGKDNEFGRGRR
jgi:hypothetical protein